MSKHYIRTTNKIYTEGEDRVVCKSINAAKKLSTKLQKEGNTVSASKKKSAQLHRRCGMLLGNLS